jgi:uncharacterized Zn finger protein
MARYGRSSRHSGYSRYSDDYYGWKPYVPVAARRAQAARELATLGRDGRTTAPVQIDGRRIAHTFWGKAWCDNLERYSDFANRLPRGRSYVRNGSVVDLQIAPGSVTALVSGSDLYRIQIVVKAVPTARWQGVCRDCSGAIDSLVELLQGRLSAPVMSRICEPKTGLFPEPGDMSFACSCPDWASMCKHVAATLYGVGARLDERPDLLFLLRSVAQEDLIAKAAGRMHAPAERPGDGRVLDSGDLGEMFGIEIAEPGVLPRPKAARGKPRTQVAALPAAKPPVAAPKPAPRSKTSAAERRAASKAPIAASAPKTSTRGWMSAAQRRAVSAPPSVLAETKMPSCSSGTSTMLEKNAMVPPSCP